MKTLPISLVLLFLVCNSGWGATNRDACEPAPAVQKRLNEMETAAFLSLPQAQRIRQGGILLKSIADGSPDDLFAQSAYLKWVKSNADAAIYEKTLKQYQDALALSPDDPDRLFLLGSILKDADASFSYYQKALEKSESFPLLLNAVASFYYPRSRDQELKATLDRWISLCPSVLNPYSYMDYLKDDDYQKTHAEQLRTLLAKMKPEKTGASYKTLWALEFSTTPVENYNSVRTKVRQDLLRFSNSRDLSIEQLGVLKEGNTLLNDQDGVRRAEDQLVRSYPNSDEAADLITTRWHDEHPDAEESAEAQAAYMKVTEDWQKRWPQNQGVNLERLFAVEQIDGLPSAVVTQAVERVLDDARALPGEAFPPLQFVAARVLIRNHLLLDKVSGLIEEGLDSGMAFLKMGGPASEEKTNRMKENLNWRADCLRADAALAVNDQAAANQILAKLKNVAAQISRPEARNAREAEYWVLMAKLAVAGKRDADALAYYQLALHKAPDGLRDEKDARALWDRLGGTNEGWLQFRQASDEGGAGGFMDQTMPMPEFELTDTQGHTWKKANLNGKITYINVWATWCVPCMIELPLVEQLYQKLKDQKDVQIVSFNIDENPGLIAPSVEKYGLHFPVVPASDLVLTIRPTPGIPINWIVNQEAVIVKEAVGFNTERKANWNELVQAAISGLQQKH